MNGAEVLRIVDAIHRDKNIDKSIVFAGIELAILSAARKHFGEERDVVVEIDHDTGAPVLTCEGELVDPDELGVVLGRVSAQTAKQVMIQKIREAERDALYDEFMELRGQIVSGSIGRIEHGSATVNLAKLEGFLPRSEQIPGDNHRVGERVRAVVMDVRKSGSRVKVILSRNHPELVRRLFELEIPEVSEHVIEVRSLAREAGYRSKVAVSCFDTKVDPVGACVGVRGSRIKSIVEELAGERIDIVRWNDSLQVLVPNALQPAEVEDVILCPMLGKVIVLVREDQLSLAIGKKGQNVRLASKLVGWDIHVMTQERLDEQLDGSIEAFSAVPDVNEDLAENLVSQGFFTFDDLSVIEPDQLKELSGLSEEACTRIVDFADVESVRIEEEERVAAAEARRQARLRASAAAAGVAVDGADATDDNAAGAAATDAEPAADTETADTETADTETADTEAAGTETADTETADAETADAETADAETPEPSAADEETQPSDDATEAEGAADIADDNLPTTSGANSAGAGGEDGG